MNRKSAWFQSQSLIARLAPQCFFNKSNLTREFDTIEELVEECINRKSKNGPAIEPQTNPFTVKETQPTKYMKSDLVSNPADIIFNNNVDQ